MIVYLCAAMVFAAGNARTSSEKPSVMIMKCSLQFAKWVTVQVHEVIPIPVVLRQEKLNFLFGLEPRSFFCK